MDLADLADEIELAPKRTAAQQAQLDAIIAKKGNGGSIRKIRDVVAQRKAAALQQAAWKRKNAAALRASKAHIEFHPAGFKKKPPPVTTYKWVDRQGHLHFSDGLGGKIAMDNELRYMASMQRQLDIAANTKKWQDEKLADLAISNRNQRRYYKRIKFDQEAREKQIALDTAKARREIKARNDAMAEKGRDRQIKEQVALYYHQNPGARKSFSRQEWGQLQMKKFHERNRINKQKAKKGAFRDKLTWKNYLNHSNRTGRRVFLGRRDDVYY